MNNMQLNDKIIELENKIKAIEETKKSNLRSFIINSMTKRNNIIGIIIAILLTTMIIYATQINFIDGTIISASDVNNNFNELYDKVNTLDLKKPRVIRTSDIATGCPAARSANTDLIVQNFHLDTEATVHIAGSMVRNYSGRSDFFLLIDGQIVDRSITFTPTLQWVSAQTLWAGSLTVGDHTVSVQGSVSDAWGCGEQWGNITTMIFE